MFGFQFPSISKLQYHQKEQEMSVIGIWKKCSFTKVYPNMTSIQDCVFHGWERFKQGGVHCNILT